MAIGSNTGNGSDNPFGDGAGKQAAGAGGESMPDFTRNPQGTQVGGVKPRDFLRPPPEKSGQKMSDGADANPQDRAPGPPTAAEAANAPPQRPGGVGSVGNAAKPFTLGGGGGGAEGG